MVFTLCMCKSPTKKSEPSNNEITNRVILSSEIEWEKLNPARGDKSPQAGTVWGDRKGTVATGFLAKFVDGFSSPPHIHNVTYRAMVIKGLIHNDDANAKKMWMPSGSFWTQPAGASHITAAKGEENIAYVEIDKGPYLVKPTEEAFDTGEKPINVDVSNIMWLGAKETYIVQESDNNINEAKIAFLWESDVNKGYLIKLAGGFKGKINSIGSVFHAIVIQGKPTYQMPNETEFKMLDAGSYFTSKGISTHSISNNKAEESIIYVRTDNDFSIVSQ